MPKASYFLLQIKSGGLKLKNILFSVCRNFGTRNGHWCKILNPLPKCEIMGSGHLRAEMMQNFALITKSMRNRIVVVQNAPECVLFFHLLT